MNYVIQCTNAKTGEIGDFLTNDIRPPFYPLSPTFDSLNKLFNYARKHKIKLNHEPFKPALH